MAAQDRYDSPSPPSESGTGRDGYYPNHSSNNVPDDAKNGGGREGGLQRTQSKAKSFITGLFRRRSDAVPSPLGDQDPNQSGRRRAVSDGDTSADYGSSRGGRGGGHNSSRHRRHRDSDDPGLRDERRRKREREQAESQAQYGRAEPARRRTNPDLLSLGSSRPSTAAELQSADAVGAGDGYPYGGSNGKREDKGKGRAASRSGNLLQQNGNGHSRKASGGGGGGDCSQRPSEHNNQHPQQSDKQLSQRRRLSSWPPSGMSSTEELRLGTAMDLIARGVPAFKGHKRPIQHASPPEAFFALYTTTAGNHGDDSDAATLHDSMTTLSTLRIATVIASPSTNTGNGSGTGAPGTDKTNSAAAATAAAAATIYPWETLEQPSMAFAYGKRPGTTTLNHWVGKSSSFPAGIPLRDPGMPPRPVDLIVILDRLKELEHGIERDEERDTEEMMYGLYRRFLKDPDARATSRPQKKPVPQQIMDLVMALSSNGVVSTASPPPSRHGTAGDAKHGDDYSYGDTDIDLGREAASSDGRPAQSKTWIDFTNPRNQVVTKYFYDSSPENYDACTRFFYQLLLGLELELRINSSRHEAAAKERLMAQIPPRIQYDMALARRWRDNIRIDHWGHSAEELRLRCKLRKRQVKMLRRFAQMMKWPNLSETLHALRKCDEEGTAVNISSHAMAFFSGLVIPGVSLLPQSPLIILFVVIDINFVTQPTFPFLLMNALIDVDPDRATDELALLTHLHPNCGFQYRNSYTYWTSTCIVGKVLAPTCHEAAGWIGPAKPTTDLDRSQIARIRTRRPRDRMNPQNILAMSEDSDPLGPPAKIYPVEEYELHSPDTEDTMDTVRMELLGLTPVSDRKTSGPTVFDASIQFAIDGSSWPLLLMHDVSFINAWPCSDGPHPLYFDYVFKTVKADEILGIHDWGRSDSAMGLNGANPSVVSVPGGGSRAGTKVRIKEDDDADRVLVIEAFGARDNEVLARAWCAHWGLCAIVADLTKTW